MIQVFDLSGRPKVKPLFTLMNGLFLVILGYGAIVTLPLPAQAQTAGDLQEVQRQLEQNPELWNQAQQLLLENPALVQQVLEKLLKENPQLIQQIQQSPELMKLAAQQGQILVKFLQQNQQLFQELQESLGTLKQSLPQQP